VLGHFGFQVVSSRVGLDIESFSIGLFGILSRIESGGDKWISRSDRSIFFYEIFMGDCNIISRGGPK
jgi:hypothetical protein